MLGVHIHLSRRLPSAAMLPGGRNRPPYNTRQTAGETGNFAFAADVSFPGTHLRGIVGRAFTPAAVTSGCPAFPVQCPLCSAKLPAIAAFPGRCLASSRKAAGYRNAWGAHSPFPPPSVCRHVARRAKSPALQYKANGRRNRKLCLCGRRFFPRHPFAGDCRAGVHARRGDFRLPRPSRSNARFALQSFPQSRRFRADENHRPLRKRSGDPQSFRLVLYCPPPDF